MEEEYLRLVRNVLQRGNLETTRNGDTLTLFGEMMKFDLKDGQMPLLTTKHVAWKTCLKELLWFISGDTSAITLQSQNVHIWDANSSREFLDSRRLEHYPEGDLGPVYGFQWRHFGAHYLGSHADYTGQGVDQLQQVIDALKSGDKQRCRRLVISAWNPLQLDEMALPPCHMTMQFHVRDGKFLSCALFQRSCDIGLGVPFNIASYSFLTHILAAHCGLEADEFTYFLGNAHIYVEHIESLKLQLQRSPLEPPRITIRQCHEKIEEYTVEDVCFVKPYEHASAIRMPFIA